MLTSVRSNDIRAFYAISESEGFEPIFRPFPGHDNLDENGRVKPVIRVVVNLIR